MIGDTGTDTPPPWAEAAGQTGPGIAEAIAATARATGFATADLYGRGRDRRLAAARQVAIWRARRSTGASSPALGRHFGRDHTTVLHAVRRVEALRARHGGYRDFTDALRHAVDRSAAGWLASFGWTVVAGAAGTGTTAIPIACVAPPTRYAGRPVVVTSTGTAR